MELVCVGLSEIGEYVCLRCVKSQRSQNTTISDFPAIGIVCGEGV